VLAALGAGSFPSDPDYDSFSHGIYIHNNTYSRTGVLPEASHVVKDEIVSQFGDNEIAHILFDGINYPNATEDDLICVDESEDIFMANMNVFAQAPTVNNTMFNCSHEGLPEVSVNAPTKNW
jgi:hypothetical protein